MIVDKKIINKILGLDPKIDLEPEDMAKNLKITFYPFEKEFLSKNVLEFSEELKNILINFGVEIIPYRNSKKFLPIKKIVKLLLYSFNSSLNRFFKKSDNLSPRLGFLHLCKYALTPKVKKGLIIVMLGENKAGNLPVDKVASFRDNPIITIVDMPEGIDNQTDFNTHFETSMKLFVYHMSHIIIGVDEKRILLYNLNAAHPIFDRKDSESHILKAFVPKIAAPIKPLRLSDVEVIQNGFNIDDDQYKSAVSDMVSGANLFVDTKMYPPGKSVADLPFRNEFYKWAVSLHMDKRNGMSYGFIAKQLGSKAPKLIRFDEFSKTDQKHIDKINDFFVKGDKLYIGIEITKQKYFIEVPEINVLTQRSGSDKTNVNPQNDLLLIGINHGRVFIKSPHGADLSSNFRPSYDTKVILAHALGNVLISGVLAHFDKSNKYVQAINNDGMALIHWHGYLNQDFKPTGWHEHGRENPHVACSTEQSAYYALNGKLMTFKQVFENNENYLGDIHIEPHHGTNMTFFNVKEAAEFFKRDNVTALGNKFLRP